MSQALGYAVCEEMTFDENGCIHQKDLDHYHIFRADEMPKMDVIFIETFEPSHPFGVKAVAEIPLDGVAPAVGNAVRNACGAEISSIPITPEKIWGSFKSDKKVSDPTTNVYVTGHVNPDTDSIAAALGYAWLLKERDGLNTIAARAGAVNPQTAWVLKYLQVDPPVLLTDASPRFESVMRRMDTTTPDKPLREAWLIANRTGGIAPVLNPDRSPYGLITGRSLFGFLSRQVGPNPTYE